MAKKNPMLEFWPPVKSHKNNLLSVDKLMLHFPVSVFTSKEPHPKKSRLKLQESASGHFDLLIVFKDSFNNS